MPHLLLALIVVLSTASFATASSLNQAVSCSYIITGSDDDLASWRSDIYLERIRPGQTTSDRQEILRMARALVRDIKKDAVLHPQLVNGFVFSSELMGVLRMADDHSTYVNYNNNYGAHLYVEIAEIIEQEITPNELELAAIEDLSLGLDISGYWALDEKKGDLDQATLKQLHLRLDTVRNKLLAKGRK
ncbi:MAG TPA: hypothetical protein PLH57_06860 [Oligoflexia bacterium]|nr:hypothetical protein [Oligoflexia bacterium]